MTSVLAFGVAGLSLSRSHSEHRFLAPSSKEGCRKPVLGCLAAGRRQSSAGTAGGRRKFSE